MKGNWLAALLVASCTSVAAQKLSVTEFLTPPQTTGLLAETQALAGKEEVQTTAGAHEGHRVLLCPAPQFKCGTPGYGVRYQACLEVEKHGGRGEVVAKEGMSGIGLSRPTGPNWYAGGCIDVRLAGQSIGQWRPRLVYQRWERQERVTAAYDTPVGRVTLAFTQVRDDDKLIVEGEIEADQAAAVQVELRCFPGGTHGDMQRWAATSKRQQEAPARLMLRPSEAWVLCADAKMDRALSEKWQGCAAAMFDPAEATNAFVEVTGYPVNLTIDYPAGTKRFHLALWEFPTRTNEEALAYMRELDGKLRPSGLLPAGEEVVADAPPGALAVGGKPAATIVLPSEPEDELILAARQLQSYLQKISGALLPAATEDDEVMGNRVLLGVRDSLGPGTAPVTNDEGYAIKSVGRDLAIVGGSDLGTFYGVCGLLEDHLGVRWYVPGDALGECVPKMRDIVLRDLDDQQAPSFPMRWIGRGNWSMMNRQNRGGDGLEAGFKIEPSIYHSQGRLMPPRAYFDEHPEYFALVKGSRCRESHVKLCNSNPEVVRAVAENMRKLLDADPDLDLASFSPTDGTLYCECAGCLAMDEVGELPRDQRMSQRMLLFYNRLADEVTRTHPDAKLLIGAYHVYTRPPVDESIRAHPALSVVICHYEDYCMAHPVNDPTCPRNQVYDSIINEWQKRGCDIYFYEYYWKVNWMDLPWPITHAQAADIPYFLSVGVKGVYTQFNEQNAWMLFPAYYVPAKLLWNVDADVDAILDEMCDRLFGKAGPAMREYYQIMEDSMANCGQHFPGHGTAAGRHVFTDEVLRAMGEALARAHELAEDDLVEKRLAKIDLSYEYTQRLISYANLRASIESRASAQEALATAQQALNLLEGLVNEVREDRAKWNGIVSTSVVSKSAYLGKEVLNLRKRAERMQAQAVKTIAELPKTWKFQLDPADVGQEERWFAPDLDDTGWENIEIGKPWEDQGHEGYDGFAWYRLKLKVEPAWLAAKAQLTFDGVDGEAWVYLNGEPIGHHEGWDEPFSLPLKAEQVKAGEENCLAVRVWDGSNQGGIYRRVAITEPASQ